jgi:uncharacterized protein (DUF697 family)
VLGRANLSSAELDRMILNAAVTNAALELLPETLASMAIIPLQVRLVYRIGKSHGYPMDSSNAKDFIATLGVGLTSQYVEQLGRKLLGGLLGTVAGGIGRGLGHQAASSGLTFATTYAIGPRGTAVLLVGSNARRTVSQGDVRVAAGGGARAGAGLSPADRADGGHDRRTQHRLR